MMFQEFINRTGLDPQLECRKVFAKDIISFAGTDPKSFTFVLSGKNLLTSLVVITDRNWYILYIVNVETHVLKKKTVFARVILKRTFQQWDLSIKGFLLYVSNFFLPTDIFAKLKDQRFGSTKVITVFENPFLMLNNESMKSIRERSKRSEYSIEATTGYGVWDWQRIIHMNLREMNQLSKSTLISF